jgi:hypothetical protein
MAGNKIDSYEIIYSGGKFPARILLKANTSAIAQLVFHPNDSILPPDGFILGRTSINYHIDDFRKCIDILRNESPIFFSFTGVNSENSLNTGSENVGDGDKN